LIFFLAKIKDLIHISVKTRPVIKRNILEIPAIKLLKGLDPLIKDLKISAPPRNAIIPKMTTICINIICLDGNFSESDEKIRIGNPIKVGIKEVIELLPPKRLLNTPQKIRIKP
tara:strand:+ start:378 stop:719 length:342 start_codon:yes stop_codon:yes gene_type:complete